MKRFIPVILFFFAFPGFGQQVRFGSIEVLPEDSSLYRIIFVSADWCGICCKNRQIIEDSKSIAEVANGQVSFFELKESSEEVVRWNNQLYHFEATGPNEGRHALVGWFMKQAGTKSFPLFIIANRDDEIIGSYSGLISESEMVSLVSTMVMRRQLPDSVTSN